MNHPIRVAERAAVLDILSGGRLEFGTARASTWTELGGFEVDPDDDSLALRNEHLGYPRRLLNADGVEHDYIVIPIDKPHPSPSLEGG